MNSGYSAIDSILELVANDSFVSQYDVLLYEHTTVKRQLKLRVDFIDQSILFTNDFIGADKRKYAFHWQRADGTWLVRWDNAPHFPKLASFPHHQHDYRSGSEIVTDSVNITLAEVLAYIRSQLTHPNV